MSEKIAVHCPTEELLGKAIKKAVAEGYNQDKYEISIEDWASYEEKFCLALWVDDKILTCHPKGKSLEFTIIPAEEWLAELKVGDSVEVVGGGYTFTGKEGVVISEDGDNNTAYCRISVAGYPTEDDWPIEKANLKLIESEDSMKFKEGDEVKVISGHYRGVGGIVTEQTSTSHVRFKSKGSHGYCLDIKDVELIEPTYTVPLRVDDKVRVVRASIFDVRAGDIGKVLSINSGISSNGCDLEMDRHINGNTNKKGKQGHGVWIHTEDLELIPTEQDIVVGSVWESSTAQNEKFKRITIEGVFPNYVTLVGTIATASFELLLTERKLIHRGDEEKKMEENTLFTSAQQKKVVALIDDAYKRAYKKATGGKELPTCEEILNKTNKKEKKMKKAEKVAKVGGLVRDENCGNHGKIEAIYPEQGKVTYTDLTDNTIHTVDVNRLSIPVVMPKVKPVKKKKKTTKKRGS